MRRLLTSCIADCTRDDEGAHGPNEAVWQHINRLVDLVLHRQNVLVVVDQADVPAAGIEENLLSAKIVRRSV
ncbi:hypothetical protein D9M72_594640 [compost metagenome]